MVQRADGMLNKVYLTESRLNPRLDPASIAFAFRTVFEPPNVSEDEERPAATNA